jgi:hypothetical protein
MNYVKGENKCRESREMYSEENEVWGRERRKLWRKQDGEKTKQTQDTSDRNEDLDAKLEIDKL